MQISLTQFEQIDGIRSQMLRADRGLPLSVVTFPRQAAPAAVNLARLESRLFDAAIEMLGYADACEIADLGEWADSLITDCLIGKVSVLDAEAA